MIEADVEPSEVGVPMLEISEAIKTVAPVVTALIAFLALRNWQRQDKAKREAEFLDQLIDAVHAYLAAMPRPVTLFEIAKMGMAAHASSERAEESAGMVEGAIAYIQKHGEEHGKRLSDALNEVRPDVVKLKTLAVKGQIFGFRDYAKCQNAVTMLAWQFDRIEAAMAVIGSPSLYWENPRVLDHLKSIMAIEVEDIQQRLADSNVGILEFASETYKRIYGLGWFKRRGVLSRKWWPFGHGR